MLMYTCVAAELIMGLQDKGEYEIIEINHGCVKALKTPEGLVVSSLQSTDPTDYLKEAFVPGTPIARPKNPDGFDPFMDESVE